MEKDKLLERDSAWFQKHGAANTAREILQQPRLWRDLAATLRSREEEIRAFLEPVLAIPGLRILWTGAGSSAFVGESIQKLLTRELGLPGEAVASTDIVSTPDVTLRDVPTLMISFARSGNSPESTACLTLASRSIRELYNLVIVCDENSALARYAWQSPRTLLLCMPPEACDAGFAMTSSVSCMALAAWCVLAPDRIAGRSAELLALAHSVEQEMESFDALACSVAKVDYRRLVYLGSGGLHGLAREGAVKSMELTDGLVAAAYETPMGFRHGPKTILDDTTLTVHFLSPDAYTRRYDLDFLKEMAREKGKNRILAVTSQPLAESAGVDTVLLYAQPEGVNPELCAYIKGLVFLQLLSMEKSLERGCTPDTPSRKGDVNRVVRGVTIYN